VFHLFSLFQELALIDSCTQWCRCFKVVTSIRIQTEVASDGTLNHLSGVVGFDSQVNSDLNGWAVAVIGDMNGDDWTLQSDLGNSKSNSQYKCDSFNDGFDIDHSFI